MFNLTSIHGSSYRRCPTWRPSMATHPSALRQSFYMILLIQYLFPRCLPCLSWRWTHNQTPSATMDKCTDLRKYAFADPCVLDHFSCFSGYYHLSKYSTLSLNTLYILVQEILPTCWCVSLAVSPAVWSPHVLDLSTKWQGKLVRHDNASPLRDNISLSACLHMSTQL